MSEIFSGSESHPTTWCPMRASDAQLTSPTCPVPITPTLIESFLRQPRPSLALRLARSDAPSLGPAEFMSRRLRVLGVRPPEPQGLSQQQTPAAGAREHGA